MLRDEWSLRFYNTDGCYCFWRRHVKCASNWFCLGKVACQHQNSLAHDQTGYCTCRLTTFVEGGLLAALGPTLLFEPPFVQAAFFSTCDQFPCLTQKDSSTSIEIFKSCMLSLMRKTATSVWRVQTSVFQSFYVSLSTLQHLHSFCL